MPRDLALTALYSRSSCPRVVCAGKSELYRNQFPYGAYSCPKRGDEHESGCAARWELGMHVGIISNHERADPSGVETSGKRSVWICSSSGFKDSRDMHWVNNRCEFDEYFAGSTVGFTGIRLAYYAKLLPAVA